MSTSSPGTSDARGQEHKLRGWDEFRTEGLLWLINATVFHPRGFALAIGLGDDGSTMGWALQGDGGEPWTFASDFEWPDGEGPDDRFRAVEALFAEMRGAS